MFVEICVLLQRGGGDALQPERLNAEGEARELLAEGGALAQPSECRMTQGKRLKDAKAAAKYICEICEICER